MKISMYTLETSLETGKDVWIIGECEIDGGNKIGAQGLEPMLFPALGHANLDWARARGEELIRMISWSCNSEGWRFSALVGTAGTAKARGTHDAITT